MLSMKDEQLVRQLYKPRQTRAQVPKTWLIGVSLITITLCFLFIPLPFAKWTSHLAMAPYAAWMTCWSGLLAATSSARVIDIGGSQWTLSSPELDVSVPGRVPSVV